MVLENLLSWTIRMEELAGGIYRQAAALPHFSPPLRGVLWQMAEDEAQHAARLAEVQSAPETLRRIPSDQVLMDEELRGQIERGLFAAKGRIEAGTMDEAGMIQAMVDLEFSELNPIFCYLVDRCQGCSRSLQKAAADIQRHEDRLQRFVASLPEHLQPDWRGRTLPHLWERSILVVDDEPALLELCRQLLVRFGRVSTARNGVEALELIRAQAFDVILSDIDMPKLNGVELFAQAIAFDPELTGRFIFHTGTIAEREEQLMLRHRVTVLQKPVNIRLILAAVLAVMTDRSAPNEPECG